jgi:hypothetical protein
MKLSVLALTLFCAAALAGQQALSIDDVTKMVQAGVAQDLILKTIAEPGVRFQLNPDQLITLKRAGVPDDVVRAMMAGQSNVKKRFTGCGFLRRNKPVHRQRRTRSLPGRKYTSRRRTVSALT